MDFPVTLLDLAGSVALLLWGVHMVQTGVQRAFGARLRTFLGHALRNRLSAFLAGMGVTAVLQSSTATGLMVTGFAAGGLVDLVPALAPAAAAVQSGHQDYLHGDRGTGPTHPGAPATPLPDAPPTLPDSGPLSGERAS